MATVTAKPTRPRLWFAGLIEQGAVWLHSPGNIDCHAGQDYKGTDLEHRRTLAHWLLLCNSE